MYQQPNKTDIIDKAMRMAGGQVTNMKNGKFYGRLESDRPAGNGMFEFLNGDTYCGSFKGGITGLGICRCMQE